MFLAFTPGGVEFAYRRGVFPMGDPETGQIDWYLPDVRAIIPLDGFHCSHSLAKVMRQGIFEVKINADFEGTMRGCADRLEGTWITGPFYEVFGSLHRLGKAHSVEVYRDNRLVGGLYGLAIGAAFMAESMFHYETNASKVALASLVARLRERHFQLLDVQFVTPHLSRMGAVEISHTEYAQRLAQAVKEPVTFA